MKLYMAEMVKHSADFDFYARWDDADKNWKDASALFGAHVKAAVISDVIVDTPEEIEALPDEQEVVVPEKNIMGPVVKNVKTPVDEEDVTVGDGTKEPVTEETEDSKGENGKPQNPEEGSGIVM